MMMVMKVVAPKTTPACPCWSSYRVAQPVRALNHSRLAGSAGPAVLLLGVLGGNVENMVPNRSVIQHRRVFRMRAAVKCSSKASKRDDIIKKQRKFQLEATDLLAGLLKADDTAVYAAEHVEDMTESFFMVASTYLEMAKKEGNAEVTGRVEDVLRIAMAERQKILRPEIQLFNKLLQAKSSAERAELYASDGEYLTSGGGYFTGLLTRMIRDTESQKNNPQKPKLLFQLRTISKETTRWKKANK